MSVTSGGVYLWIGGVGGDPNLAANWQFVSGTENAQQRPNLPGDAAIVSSGGFSLGSATLIDNTIYLRGGKVSLVNGGLLGPVSVLDLSGTPAVGDTITLTVTAPGSGASLTVSYTVTTNDLSSGNVLNNVAQNLLNQINSSNSAALETYTIANSQGNGQLVLGSFSGAALTVGAVISAGSGSTLAASTAIEYPAASVTDTGASAGTSSTFAVSGQVYNGGTIVADVSGGQFEITLTPALSSFFASNGSGGGVNSSATVAGDLINFNQITVTSGDTLTISAVGSTSYFDNFGTINVTGGGLIVDAPMANDSGVIEIGSGGTVTLDSTIGGRQGIAFAAATPNGVLVINSGAMNGSSFDPKIVGFAAGDTIDLAGVTSAAGDTLSYSGGTLTVTSGTTTLAEISLATGIYGSTSFSTTADGNGKLEILTTASNALWLGGTSTDWGTASNWNNSTVPATSAAAVVVDNGTVTTSAVTGATAYSVGSIELNVTSGFTLDVQDALTVKRGVLSLDTTNVSGSGASLTASTFHQVGAAAVLDLTAGAALNLTGTAGSGGNTAAALDGQTIINGATLDAGGGISGTVGGYIAIGVSSPTGNVLVENGGSVTATFTVLASSKIGGGTLTLQGSGTHWTDTADDPSAYASGTTSSTIPTGMIVGLGGVADPHAGGNSTHLNVLSGASLTDNGTVLIGLNANALYGGQGNVTVADSGVWTINSASPLLVGDGGGSGQLDVVNGGQVLLNGGNIYVDVSPVSGNGNGYINVSGTGAVISTTGGLYVGAAGNGGNAQFNVGSGGHVTVGSAVLGTPGSGGGANIQANGAGAVLDISGNLFMAGQDATLSDWTGSGGPGTGASIVIGNGGSATAGATTVVSGFTISGAGTIQGDIIDNGLIFAGTSGQALTLNGGNGGGVIVGSGVLVIDNGATLDLMNIAVGTGPGGNAPTVAFNSGATGTLELGLPGSMFGNIQNFTSADQIDLTGATPANLSFSYNNNVLAVSSGGAVFANLQIGSGYSNDIFNAVADGHGGAAVTFTNQPCYCRGTRVLTDQGEVAVEDLKIDDRLITVSGLARPIRWIGTRGYAGRFAARNTEVLPIHIKPGALADNVPVRDLYVSPLHALFIDGVLIPAQNLVNGGSIVKMKAVDSVEYFHLELESHDVILAEGVPAESYLDDHNRSMFQNVGDYRTLYPDAELVQPVYCAPRLEGGEVVTAIRTRLAARAVAMGFEVPGSVSVELVVGRNRALVRAGVGEVRLLAPVFHAPGDARPLGAQIRGVAVQKVAIDLADRRLTQGFYPIETDGASKLRWTNGEAVIELDPVGHNRWCEIEVAAMAEPMVANG